MKRKYKILSTQQVEAPYGCIQFENTYSYNNKLCFSYQTHDCFIISTNFRTMIKRIIYFLETKDLLNKDKITIADNKKAIIINNISYYDAGVIYAMLTSDDFITCNYKAVDLFR